MSYIPCEGVHISVDELRGKTEKLVHSEYAYRKLYYYTLNNGSFGICGVMHWKKCFSYQKDSIGIRHKVLICGEIRRKLIFR